MLVPRFEQLLALAREVGERADVLSVLMLGLSVPTVPTDLRTTLQSQLESMLESPLAVKVNPGDSTLLAFSAVWDFESVAQNEACSLLVQIRSILPGPVELTSAQVKLDVRFSFFQNTSPSFPLPTSKPETRFSNPKLKAQNSKPNAPNPKPQISNPNQPPQFLNPT